jgi:uncharacterized membrane protein
VVKRPPVSALALLAGLFVMALPIAAWACPICAGRSVANPYAQAALLGGFVFFPFGVVYTVVRYIRAGLKRLDGAGFSTGSRDPERHSTDDGDRR